MAADSAKIIDGKAFAGRLTAAVAVQVAALVAGPDVRPGLAVLAYCLRLKLVPMMLPEDLRLAERKLRAMFPGLVLAASARRLLGLGGFIPMRVKDLVR